MRRTASSARVSRLSVSCDYEGRKLPSLIETFDKTSDNCLNNVNTLIQFHVPFEIAF